MAPVPPKIPPTPAQIEAADLARGRHWWVERLTMNPPPLVNKISKDFKALVEKDTDRMVEMKAEPLAKRPEGEELTGRDRAERLAAAGLRNDLHLKVFLKRDIDREKASVEETIVVMDEIGKPPKAVMISRTVDNEAAAVIYSDTRVTINGHVQMESLRHKFYEMQITFDGGGNKRGMKVVEVISVSQNGPKVQEETIDSAKLIKAGAIIRQRKEMEEEEKRKKSASQAAPSVTPEAVQAVAALQENNKLASSVVLADDPNNLMTAGIPNKLRDGGMGSPA